MNEAAAGKLIEQRIHRSKSKFLISNQEDEFYSIIWNGYLAAGMEWKIIGPTEFLSLFPKLPKVANDPTSDILVGRSNPDDYSS